MRESEIDGLVAEIASRVQARMTGGTTPTSGPSDCQLTGAPNNQDCDSCRGCVVKRPDDVRGLVSLGAARIAAGIGNGAADADLAGVIDHTMLKPNVSRDELRTLCKEAREYNFKTVCVNAVNVRFCAALLDGCATVPIAVVGFPLGASTPNAKAYETREAVRNGAEEIDMVINIGAMKSKEYDVVLDDIAAVVAAAGTKPVKVILETAELTHDEKVIACSLSKIAGAAFVKTSTGFGGGGATAEDITLMRTIVGPDMGVKASGGVRTAEDVRAMVKAGATRIGASASVSIVSGKSSTPKGSKGRARAGGY